MENKILIFPDPEDFLKCMEEIQKEYNKAHDKENKEKNNNNVTGGAINE